MVLKICINIQTTFIVAPMVRVENQLELAYVSQKNISLHCTSESFPPAIHYWKHSNGSAISGGNPTSSSGKSPIIQFYCMLNL